MAVLTIIFFLPAITFRPLIGQDLKNNFKANFIYYDNQRYIEEIEFIDNEKGEIIKSFNIVENNPYQNLNYPIIRQSKQGYNVYEIDNVQVKEIDLNEPSFVHRRNISDSFLIEGGAIKSYHVLNYTDTSYIVLKYHVNLYMGECLVGVSNTIYIFKNNGDLIKKFNQFNTQCIRPTITQNGMYFAYGYGGNVDEGFGYFDEVGYIIYDIQNEVNMVEKKTKKRYHEAIPVIDGNLIRICQHTYDTTHYVVFDFNKRLKYEKSYPLNCLGFFIDVNNDGFVFELEPRGSGKFRTDFYEIDFKVEEIK